MLGRFREPERTERSARASPLSQRRRPQMQVRKTKKELRAAHQERMKRRALAAVRPSGLHWRVAGLVFAVIAAIVIAGTGMVVMRIWNRPTNQASIAVNVPELSPRGREGLGLFSIYCAGCHGENAAGAPSGPPLVHKLYVRAHHNDDVFRRVINYGVRAHHWQFGDMPAIDVQRAIQRDRIIDYVRELQRANGFE